MPNAINKWTHVLPESYRSNPNVVVVLAPRSSRSRVLVMKNGTMLGVLEQKLESGRTLYQGIQVISPELKTYVEHQEVFDKYGVTMLPPRYIGPIADVPNDVLTGDLAPLIFFKDAMYQPYFDLVGFMKSRQKEGQYAN